MFSTNPVADEARYTDSRPRAAVHAHAAAKQLFIESLRRASNAKLGQTSVIEILRDALYEDAAEKVLLEALAAMLNGEPSVGVKKMLAIVEAAAEAHADVARLECELAGDA